MVISIHALREEGDRRGGSRAARNTLFLSTPSARRATKCPCKAVPVVVISIHALREEGDLLPWTSTAPSANFYPRPPRGGRPGSVWLSSGKAQFLSTPSARRATGSVRKQVSRITISIHALREEGDDKIPYMEHFLDISIHALREEGDMSGGHMSIEMRMISIHALREEGDPQAIAEDDGEWEFLSTPSARRATLSKIIGKVSFLISIHALREEGDSKNNVDFGIIVQFLSTPSARRATGVQLTGGVALYQFLSTPSARRATFWMQPPCLMVCNFYPRPPRGGRLGLSGFGVDEVVISIHALREEGDARSVGSLLYPALFLSTPSARRATAFRLK